MSSKLKTKNQKGKSISSQNWLKRRAHDPYITLSKQQEYRSRAAFKLTQINDKFKVLEQAKIIIDIGCAPGGWLQVAKQKLPTSTIIGIDITKIAPIEGIHIITGDIYDDKTLTLIADLLPEKADLIMSDMASPSSGNKELDHLRNIGLIEQTLILTEQYLKKDGNFITKVLSGKEEQSLIQQLKKKFHSVKRFKPEASYSDSSEFYLICLSFKS